MVTDKLQVHKSIQNNTPQPTPSKWSNAACLILPIKSWVSGRKKIERLWCWWKKKHWNWFVLLSLNLPLFPPLTRLRDDRCWMKGYQRWSWLRKDLMLHSAGVLLKCFEHQSTTPVWNTDFIRAPCLSRCVFLFKWRRKKDKYEMHGSKADFIFVFILSCKLELPEINLLTLCWRNIF